MKKVTILTGAGVSAESGLKTFRDAGGLWEGHDVMKVASPEGWRNNKELVLEFYNQRRKQLLSVNPNIAHHALVKLEDKYFTSIVTQNVDDLHERAGSKHVLHLHGELFKVRSTVDPQLIYEWKKDLNLEDRCEKGSQLRPHVVWFGESVPMFEVALDIVQDADILIIVGTSLQVYPAASLISYVSQFAKIYYIDPKPVISYEIKRRNNISIIDQKATVGVPELVNQLLDD